MYILNNQEYHWSWACWYLEPARKSTCFARCTMREISQTVYMGHPTSSQDSVRTFHGKPDVIVILHPSFISCLPSIQQSDTRRSCDCANRTDVYQERHAGNPICHANSKIMLGVHPSLKVPCFFLCETVLRARFRGFTVPGLVHT